MTDEEYALIVLSEELSELIEAAFGVQKSAYKLLRFGQLGTDDQEITNIEKFKMEACDVMGALEYLENLGTMGLIVNRKSVEEKKARIHEYKNKT